MLQMYRIAGLQTGTHVAAAAAAAPIMITRCRCLHFESLLLLPELLHVDSHVLKQFCPPATLPFLHANAIDRKQSVLGVW